MDEVTQAWVRNESDRKAVANGCRFDADRGQEVCDWIETYCRLWEGSRGPMVLTTWQREATMRMFGWVRWSRSLPSGGEPRWVRRFTRATIFLAKKNGKTPAAAAWALYLLAGDAEPGNHVFFAAADGKQAGLAAKHAIEMVKASPLLSEEIAINLTERKLTHIPSGSDARPLSSGDNRAARGQQGLGGSVIIDEIHVVNASFISESSIDKAGAARDEPMHIEVSTAGKDPDGYGAKQYAYGKLVEAGEVDDQSFFFLCYEAPQDLTDEKLAADPVKYGKMANPTWGRIIQESEFLSDYNRSRRSMADFADFMTMRLGVWQRSSSPWIRRTDWDACRREYTEADMVGMSCCAGLDLAITEDMSALAFVFPMDDDRFRSLCYFFLPEATVRRLSAKVPQMLEWVRDGWIIETPGERTDYRFIREAFAEKCGIFQVEKLLYDEHFAEQVTNEMAELTGVERYKLPQTITRLNEPTQNMERLILGGEFEHDGNPVLTWQMGHVNIKTDANANKRPVKPSHADHKKIDGVLSCIMALAGARQTDPDDGWFAVDQVSREEPAEGQTESEWA